MNFLWDSEKNKTNYKKHGVRFDESQTTWQDRMSIEFYDDIYPIDEERFIKIGISSKLRLLTTVFTEKTDPLESIRIISSRLATKTESKKYEEGI